MSVNNRDDRRTTPILLMVLSAVLALTTTLGMVCFNQVNDSVKTISFDLKDFIKETHNTNNNVYKYLINLDKRLTFIESRTGIRSNVGDVKFADLDQNE